MTACLLFKASHSSLSRTTTPSRVPRAAHRRSRSRERGFDVRSWLSPSSPRQHASLQNHEPRTVLHRPQARSRRRRRRRRRRVRQHRPSRPHRRPTRARRRARARKLRRRRRRRRRAAVAVALAVESQPAFVPAAPRRDRDASRSRVQH